MAKMSQNRNRGLAKFSRLRLTSKKESSNSPEKVESISNYVNKNNTVKKSAEDSSRALQSSPEKRLDYLKKESKDEMHSPYKDSLTEMKVACLNNSISDSEDFNCTKPPKIVTKPYQSKINKPKETKTKTSKVKKKCEQSTLIKITKDNFKNLDIHPEHLQMALALSKSTYESQCKDQIIKNDEKDIPTLKAPQKTRLEQFGFKTDKPKLNAEIRRTPSENSNRTCKKSRYAYITPILLLRTEEDRESLINSKKSLIICQNRALEKIIKTEKQDNKPTSELLLKYLCKGKSLFNTDVVYERNDYYINNSLISPSTAKCGCLLRNWNEIIGREKSPVRKIRPDSTCVAESNIEIAKQMSEEGCFTVEDSIKKSIDISSMKSSHGSISPDLFDSEDDDIDINNGPDLPQDIVFISSSDKTEHLSPIVQNKENLSQADNFDPDFNILETPEDNDEDVFASQSLLDFSPKKSQKSLPSTPRNSPKKNILNTSNNAIFQRDLGIEHFESYTKDLEVLSEEYIDLISSDDESTSEIYLKSVRNKQELKDHTILSYDFLETETIPKETETNSEMSELKLSEGDLLEKRLNSSEEIDKDIINGISEKGISSAMENKSFNFNNSLLNVTDYVNQILNTDSAGNNGGNSLQISGSKEYAFNWNEDPENDENISDGFSQESQSSIVISDEEVNYSNIYSTPVHYKKDRNRSEFDEFPQDQNIEEDAASEINTNEDIHFGRKSKSTFSTPFPQHSRISKLKGSARFVKKSLTQEFFDDSFDEVLKNTEFLQDLEQVQQNNHTGKQVTKSAAEIQIPKSNNNSTPDNNVIIKTENITPMPNYDDMNTPNINKELQKFGLKPLKRRRGTKLLKYLYDCTHPIVGPKETVIASDDEIDQVVAKRRRKSGLNVDSYENSSNKGSIEIVKDLIGKSENLEDLIFERKKSVRISSCQVPLQIVWHNLLSCNPEIREDILLYEPLQLEVLHSMLKEQGYKFHIQDLLTFLDKKCITIRTSQSQSRKKRY